MSDRISVTVIPSGPLKLSGVPGATFCGAPLAVDGDIYLCRCGDSSNAPFCDGTHRKNGFTGDNEAPPEQGLRVWEGRTVRTRFNPATCMHVFYCKPLDDLRARELAGDDAAATEIMRIVETCPSGALTWEAKADPAAPAPRQPAAAVEIIEGGEVRLQAPFDINLPRNDHQPDDRATLCRCGRSRNKPWCDGRHKGRKDFR